MDERMQSGAPELTEPLEASAEAVETAATETEEIAEAANDAAEALETPVEAAESAVETAPEAEETEEELSPEAAFVEAMMADRRPAEDLPIEELPLAEKPVRAPEAPKLSKGKKIAIVVAAVALLAGLLALTLYLTRNKGQQGPELTAEEVGENSRVDMNEMMKYGSFAYTDESLAEKYNAQTAVKVGDHELKNGLLQIFYWSMVYQDLNENADYLSFRGPDTTRPFAEQKYGENVNWEQHYLQTALDYYLQNVALYDEAVKNGTTVSAETQELLDTLPETVAAQATQYGFEDVDDYLAQSFGPGVTMDDYVEYYRISSLAFTHATKLQQDITVSADEISKFYDDHAEEYTAQGVEKTDQNVVNVRHILVMPEVDTDSDGDANNDASSDAAWAAAETRINEIYAEWREEPTEDGFALLASTRTDDSGSAENGGLYEDIYPGQMVQEFNDWCFDPSRKPGDTGIVRTDYGYHLMYFSSEGDQPYWQTVAESECIYDKFNQIIDELFSKYEIKPDYKNLHIFDIISRSAAADAAAAAETGEEEP